MLIKAGVVSPSKLTWLFGEIRRSRKKNSTDFIERDI